MSFQYTDMSIGKTPANSAPVSGYSQHSKSLKGISIPEDITMDSDDLLDSDLPVEYNPPVGNFSYARSG